MTYERQHNGSYLFTDIVGAQSVKQVYYGYTLHECKQLFRAYLSRFK